MLLSELCVTSGTYVYWYAVSQMLLTCNMASSLCGAGLHSLHACESPALTLLLAAGHQAVLCGGGEGRVEV